MHTLIRTLLPLLALSACVVETEPRNVPNTPTETDPRTAIPRPLTPEICEDDALEPNDAVAVETEGAFPDLILSTDDIDRFAVTLAPGESVWADAWFSNSDGNLDLYITDVGGEILAYSTTDDDGETAELLNDGPNAIDVIVETNLYMAPPDTCMAYGLEILVTTPAAPATPPPTPVTPLPTPPPPTPPVCVDDASEPNNDYNSAYELLPLVDGDTIFDFVANDVDAFYLTATPDEDLQIIVHHDTPGASFAVDVFDPAGLLASGIAAAGADLVFDVAATPTGRVIDIELEPYQANVCAPYFIEVRSVLLVCEEDVYEPNDAVPVYATVPLDLTLFDGDTDLYAVDLLPGEELQVDAYFQNIYGNVDLELFDANGVSLDWSTSNTDDESLLYFNDTPFTEELTIQATLFDADLYTCQDVVLDWIVYGAVCYDDDFEFLNDYAADATELLPSTGQTLFYDMIADDDDWYYIETFAGEAVDVFIVHDTPGASLDLTVFDAVGQLDYTFTDVAGLEVGLSLPVTFPGDVYDLNVRPLSGPGTCMPYTLTVVSY